MYVYLRGISPTRISPGAQLAHLGEAALRTPGRRQQVRFTGRKNQQLVQFLVIYAIFDEREREREREREKSLLTIK